MNLPKHFLDVMKTLTRTNRNTSSALYPDLLYPSENMLEYESSSSCTGQSTSSESEDNNVDLVSIEEDEDTINTHSPLKTNAEEIEVVDITDDTDELFASYSFPVIEDEGSSVFTYRTSCKEEETNLDTVELLDEDNDYKEFEYDDNFEVCPPTDNSDGPMLVGHYVDITGLRRKLHKIHPGEEKPKILAKFKERVQSRIRTGTGTTYACNKCEYFAKTYNSLKIHKDFVHKGIRYSCDECNYTASNPGNLKNHKEGVHSQTKYACDQCDYSGTKPGLYAHKKREHGGKKFPCKQCKYFGLSLRALKKHKDNMHYGGSSAI